MSRDQLPTALNTSTLVSDTRQDTQEDDSSTQNNDVADLLPLNGVDAVPTMDAGDVFLGAGICQTTPQTGPPLNDGGAEARMSNRWMNGMRSGLGHPSTGGLIDQESEGYKPNLFENENVNFGTPYFVTNFRLRTETVGRPRQNNSGIAPIAEGEEQRNVFLSEINSDVTSHGNRPQDWLMTPPSTGIRLSESLLQNLPPTAYPSPVPGPGSSLYDFPQNPVWRREDSSVVSLPSHLAQSIPMKTRFPYQNSRTGCSVLEVATPREDGALLQPRVSTVGGMSGSGSSQGLRQDRLRRDQILFLSQNPLGPNTILRGQSCPPNNPSWKFKNTSPGQIHLPSLPDLINC